MTAVVGPSWQAYRAGHWHSAFAGRAVDLHGAPVPWYSYPCIEFLKQQDFSGCRVLEFGGGQSTGWWSARALEVVTLDADLSWVLQRPNVIRWQIAASSAAECVEGAELVLDGMSPFGIVVIDGLHRSELVPIGLRFLKKDGALIVDNSSGYGIFEALRNSGMSRVDFYGGAPGVVLPQCTSIFFRERSFLFNNTMPIVEYH